MTSLPQPHARSAGKPHPGRRLCLTAVLGLSLLAAGCSAPSDPQPAATPSSPAVGVTATKSSGQPAVSTSAAPLSAEDRKTVDRILGDWRHTRDHVINIPPLTSVSWRPLKAGAVVTSDSLVITDAATTLTLRFPLEMFTAEFVQMVQMGQVLGYHVSGKMVDLEVARGSLFPLRPTTSVHVAGVQLRGTVDSIKGAAIYTDDPRVAIDFKALQAHNAPYTEGTEVQAAPSLAPEPVHVKRGLGIRGTNVASLDGKTIQGLGLDSPEGVYVEAVLADSPADRAGIKAFDVIQHVDASPVHDAHDLMVALSKVADGATVTIEVKRYIIDKQSSETYHIKVTLGEFSGDAHAMPH